MFNMLKSNENRLRIKVENPFDNKISFNQS